MQNSAVDVLVRRVNELKLQLTCDKNFMETTAREYEDRISKTQKEIIEIIEAINILCPELNN